jgi:hypothetical protein
MMIYLLLYEQSNILIIKEPLPAAEVPNTFNNPHNKKATLRWLLNDSYFCAIINLSLARIVTFGNTV